MKALIISEDSNNSKDLIRSLYKNHEIICTEVTSFENMANFYNDHKEDKSFICTLVDIQITKNKIDQIINELESYNKDIPLIFFGDGNAMRSTLPQDFYERTKFNSTISQPFSEEEIKESFTPIINRYREATETKKSGEKKY